LKVLAKFDFAVQNGNKCLGVVHVKRSHYSHKRFQDAFLQFRLGVDVVHDTLGLPVVVYGIVTDLEKWVFHRRDGRATQPHTATLHDVAALEPLPPLLASLTEMLGLVHSMLR
jgi:hypothetical protein